MKCKADLYVFRECVALSYKHFGLNHRFVALFDDVMSLNVEGGNTIVFEARDPKQSRASRLYLK